MRNVSKRTISFVAIISLLSACTSITVDRVDRNKYPIKLICIEENTEVSIPNFTSIISDSFQARNINTLIYRGDLPERCEYSLSYDASMLWDLVSYLRRAEFKIKKSGNTIAAANYFHAGGLDFSKYGSVESKVVPVLDGLLVDFQKNYVSTISTTKSDDKYAEISKLKGLLDSGAISIQEYQQEKDRILSRP